MKDSQIITMPPDRTFEQPTMELRRWRPKHGMTRLQQKHLVVTVSGETGMAKATVAEWRDIPTVLEE